MSRNFDGGENLEENKDYRVYRYGDDLKPGYELKVEHSVSCENVDISALIAMGTESLEAMRQGSIDGEQKAYANINTSYWTEHFYAFGRISTN